MEGEQLKPSMDWVTRRHECSPLEVFLELKEGAKDDVASRNKLLRPKDDFKFTVASHSGKAFSVLYQGSIYGCVMFSWTPAGIKVTDGNDDNIIQQATLTLTDKGECKLKLKNGEELNCWQFRKRVLESLFFNEDVLET